MSDYDDVEVQEESDLNIPTTPRFTDLNIPVHTESKDENKIDASDAVISAQEKIINGLSVTMSDITLENMQKLAPEDEFTISISGKDKIFKRNKLTPKQLRDLKKTEREYNEEIKKVEDPELKTDREYQLLAYKANLFLGMTPGEFEECDIEYLNQVLQATELRSQGFRKC